MRFQAGGWRGYGCLLQHCYRWRDYHIDDLSFLVAVKRAAPTGRPAGSLAWAGLANLYYWIDRKNGLSGYWATQIFPFVDPTSVGGYLDFERSARADYRHRMPRLTEANFPIGKWLSQAPGCSDSRGWEVIVNYYPLQAR
jgi:hypothetical protein